MGSQIGSTLQRSSKKRSSGVGKVTVKILCGWKKSVKGPLKVVQETDQGRSSKGRIPRSLPRSVQKIKVREGR